MDRAMLGLSAVHITPRQFLFHASFTEHHGVHSQIMGLFGT
jgi:hypothetical protein